MVLNLHFIAHHFQNVCRVEVNENQTKYQCTFITDYRTLDKITYIFLEMNLMSSHVSLFHIKYRNILHGNHERNFEAE